MKEYLLGVLGLHLSLALTEHGDNAKTIKPELCR